MIFFWPHVLWLLIPVVVLAVADSVWRGNGESAKPWPKILRAWAGARQAAIGNGHRSARGRLLLWLGLFFGIVALARPQWGRVEEPVFDQSREIIIALDLSRSMLAPDIRPSRLERARLLIKDLLDGLQGERVGLVVFAGTAFLQVPLSADYEVLNEFLPMLNPGFMPVGGTDYEAMLHAVLDGFSASSTADRYLIVLSDGESQTDGWRDLLDDLRKKNIRVIGLGVGTADGAFIPDEGGSYVKDERGAVVLSKLNSSTLQEIASATNGVYRDASTWVDLGAVLKQTVESGRRGEFKERIQVRQVERFQWALAPALVCLLLSLWREIPVRPRVRNLPLASNAGDRKAEAGERKADTGNRRAGSGESGPDTGKSARAGGGRSPTTGAVSAAVVLLAALSGIRHPVSGFAAEDTSVYAQPLGKLVEQLSDQPGLSAADCASLAKETITWGKRMREANQNLTPGPLNDALAGVQLGEKLARDAADWPQFRSQLQALLKKPPEPPPQQQPPPSQEQKKQEQNKGQEQKSDTQPKSTPPPEQAQANTGDTQKIGGQQRPQQGAKGDPSLALPIQKLDQLRNQDSPAELFQMLDSRENKPSLKKGRDW